MLTPRRGLAIIAAFVAVLAIAGGIIYATQALARLAVPASLSQPTWTLTQMTLDGRERTILPDDPPTLEFDLEHGQVSGNAGCNWYGGTYHIAGERFTVTDTVMTAMACASIGPTGEILPDDPRMAQESDYLQALGEITRYHLDGSTLTLSNADSSTTLIFTAEASRATPTPTTTGPIPCGCTPPPSTTEPSTPTA